MPVKLHCVENGHVGEEWTLDLDGPMTVVRGHLGEVIGEFTPEDAVRRLQMPSFSQSIKFFGLQLDERLWRFEVSKIGLKEVRAFINRTIVAAGPEAVLAVRKQAIRDTLAGLVCVIGGAAMPVGGIFVAANKPEGATYHISWGLVAAGLAMLGKGIYGLVQYGNLKQL